MIAGHWESDVLDGKNHYCMTWCLRTKDLDDDRIEDDGQWYVIDAGYATILFRVGLVCNSLGLCSFDDYVTTVYLIHNYSMSNCEDPPFDGGLDEGVD